MARADLHVHSIYSEHPAEWFLKRLGAKESYTEPETVYRMAKERGMDFVTITDHNRIEGSLLLCASHPGDTFTGVEFTTYFPEDGCKVHILVYGLTAAQFEDLQALRSNIYQFRHYLSEARLPHSVAHATYPVNGKLGTGHLERLLVMFDVFEGLNGGRNAANNRAWQKVLSALTPDRMRLLQNEHGVFSLADEPWRKGLTGGSDDHAGLFIGQTSTEAAASTPEEFLQALLERQTTASGRSNNYKSLVFTVYKIAYDFSRQKPGGASRGLVRSLTDLVFEKRDFRLKEKLFLRKLTSSGSDRSNIYRLIDSLVSEVRSHGDGPVEQRLDLVYTRIADLADEFMRSLVRSIKKDVTEGDLIGFASNFSASIPGMFLAVPFFTAVRDMFANRSLLDRLGEEFLQGDAADVSGKRVLWFTDTFTDLNGVSVTLNKIAEMAGRSLPSFRIVTARDESGRGTAEHGNVIDLPCIDSFELPGYEKYVLKVPSVLKALEIVARFEPDEVFISTPGPIGLVGLLVARLMSAKVVGFFHTDYSRQAERIIADESVTGLIDSYIRWFYGCCDEVRVPTDEYISILDNRGYGLKNAVRFDRGIDTGQFAPAHEEAHRLARELGLDKGPVLLYTGRVSREKNLDLALAAYTRILERFGDARLLVAGDGPGMEELAARARELDGVRFLGRVPNGSLPALYSLADLFVFPSDTDTFGMSVLEAQACGLPAVVSSTGGPREIIRDGETGYIARSGDVEDWVARIGTVLEMMRSDRRSYDAMRRAARERVLHRYDWSRNFAVLFSGASRPVCGKPAGPGSTNEPRIEPERLSLAGIV